MGRSYVDFARPLGDPVTVPARRPVDDALDRIEYAGGQFGNVVHLDDAATVRSELERLREERDRWNALHFQCDRLQGALRAICQTNDSGPWIEVYREHGGGYEGLQAIAEAALREEELREVGGVW